VGTHVRRLDASDSNGAAIDKLAFEVVLTSSLRAGDLILCTAGDVMPVDGQVVEGGSFAEQQIRAGTRVTSRYVVVRVVP
jgi:high-affinity K+ transport system ATPase subunit B